MNANWLLVRKSDDRAETGQLRTAPLGRMNAATWVDRTGRLWLFGGRADYGSHDRYFADLWYYDTTNFQWNLIHESPSSTDFDSGAFPPPRDWPSCWIDEAGGLLLYGGGQNNAILQDLWRFDPSLLKWTCVSKSPGETSITVPSPRWGAAQWRTADATVVLFGGQGFQSDRGRVAPFNDLWIFRPESGWIELSSDKGQIAGDKRPKSQVGAALCTTPHDFWLVESDIGDFRNGGLTSGDAELWHFDYTMLKWKLVDACGNSPERRNGATFFAMSSDKLILCLGHGGGILCDDLWQFDISKQRWTKVDTLDTPMPSPRSCPATWFDAERRLWLFSGYEGEREGPLLDDLWVATGSAGAAAPTGW